MVVIWYTHQGQSRFPHDATDGDNDIEDQVEIDLLLLFCIVIDDEILYMLRLEVDYLFFYPHVVTRCKRSISTVNVPQGLSIRSMQASSQLLYCQKWHDGEIL